MKSNINKNELIDSKQLYKILSPALEILKDEYDYAQISDNLFDTWVSDVINTEYKKIVSDDKKVDIFIFEASIRKKINDYIKKRLSDDKSIIEMFNSFFKKNVKLTKNYEKNVIMFKKVSDFFINLDYFPEPDMYLEILNTNDSINIFLDDLVSKNISTISEGHVDLLFDDNILVSFIEIYCMVNDIEIKEQSDSIDDVIIDENYYSEDIANIYLKSINKPLLSIEEERKLCFKIKNGDLEAKNFFIERNLRLVVSIAKKYIGKGLSFLDLIQEGNMGLMVAVDKYDISKGYKFSTYAFHWINKQISRAVYNTGRNIRLPINLHLELVKYNKAFLDLTNRFGRTPTVDEMANELNISVKKTMNLYKLQSDTVSYNSLITDESDEEMECYIPSPDNLEDKVISDVLSSELMDLIHKCDLTQREFEVLMLRYGFINDNPLPLRAVGKKLGVSCETVRKEEVKALSKIRNSSYIKDFVVYMENPDESLKNLELFEEKFQLTMTKKKKNREDSVQKSEVSDKKMWMDLLKQDASVIEKPKRKERKSLANIYHYFDDYSEAEVTYALQQLPESDLEILYKRYGKDLLNPIKNDSILMSEKSKIYNSILPKMRKILADERINRTILPSTIENSTESTVLEVNHVELDQENNHKNDIGDNQIQGLVETPVTDSILATQQDESDQAPLEIVPTPAPIEVSQNSSDVVSLENFSKDDYIKVLGIFNTPQFIEMTKNRSLLECLVLSLKLGYIDGKYFSTTAIANFLDIDISTVNSIVKDALIDYKEKLNQMIDQAIESESLDSKRPYTKIFNNDENK